MKKIVFLLSLMVTTSALANEACDKPRNDFDGLYCLNKVYQEADAELNRNYQVLRKMLNAEERKILKRGQIQWIKARDNNCSRHEGNDFFVNLDCATNTTIKRSQFLQDRIRECKSSGCLKSRL